METNNSASVSSVQKVSSHEAMELLEEGCEIGAVVVVWSMATVNTQIGPRKWMLKPKRCRHQCCKDATNWRVWSGVLVTVPMLTVRWFPLLRPRSPWYVIFGIFGPVGRMPRGRRKKLAFNMTPSYLIDWNCVNETSRNRLCISSCVRPWRSRFLMCPFHTSPNTGAKL